LAFRKPLPGLRRRSSTHTQQSAPQHRPPSAGSGHRRPYPPRPHLTTFTSQAGHLASSRRRRPAHARQDLITLEDRQVKGLIHVVHISLYCTAQRVIAQESASAPVGGYARAATALLPGATSEPLTLMLEVTSCGVSSAAHPGRMRGGEYASRRAVKRADGQHNRSCPGRPWPRPILSVATDGPGLRAHERVSPCSAVGRCVADGGGGFNGR
jgi:hypothetical protein